MVFRGIIVVLAFCLTFGCVQLKKDKSPPIDHIDSPFQQFIAPNCNWPSVQRIVLMPVANQTAYPKVDDEFQANLAAEIQRVGRFEIVVATRDDPGARAQDIFANGQFNELEVLRVAREYQADAVLFASVTQYHPYAPPRLGASLLLIGPAEGIAIASINGLWDMREGNTAKQAQAYFKQTLNWPRSLMGSDRMLESPDVFQRFVGQQIAMSLNPSPAGAIGPSSLPNNAGMMIPSQGTMATGGVMPIDGTAQNASELPPLPPPPPEMQ